MDELISRYWPQLVAVVTVALWLGKVDARGRSQAVELAELRRALIEAQARVASQDVALARIGESLSAIKVTLDRLYDRSERAA